MATQGTSLHVNGDNATYFDSFGVEYLSQQIFIEYQHLVQ